MINYTLNFNAFFLVCNIAFLFFGSSLYAKYPLLIYYGSDYPIETFNEYDTVVLDPDLYKDVHKLKSRSFAYVSLGEVGTCRSYFDLLQNNSLLAGKNQNWGSYHINIADGKWEKILIDKVIPPIVKSGYDGLFLDTVDSLLAREKSPEHIIHLIVTIKKRYPKLKLMLNRGFEIADIVPIDALLYESTISGYDFKKGVSSLFTYDFRFLPKHKIERYSVDYWNYEEPKNMAEIYKIALKKGYKPLVTDISLNKLPIVRLDMGKNVIEFH
ncbi:MAG: endo alpha-1,4 polygalactosaminidase [Sulfuricurvum sp.]|nr:endo alpha-1,4 polygalactosaminidase [Sulfuricurvum sp.]